MPNLSNQTDEGLRNLDVRTSMPEWELLEFGENQKTYEQEFFNSVISEFTKIAGFPVDIYLYEPERTDIFYGESQLVGYDGPYRTKLIFETPKEDYIMNIMGMSSGNTIQEAQMPKALWNVDILDQRNRKYDLDFDQTERQPTIGDIVHVLYSDEKYEIVDIDAALKVFMGRKNIWSFILKPWRVSNDGGTANEILLDSEPTSTETDERNKYFNNLSNQNLNKENKAINKLASKPELEKIKELIDPKSLKTEYYGYFEGLKK